MEPEESAVSVVPGALATLGPLHGAHINKMPKYSNCRSTRGRVGSDRYAGRHACLLFLPLPKCAVSYTAAAIASRSIQVCA